MIPRRYLGPLVLAAIALPIVICALIGIGRLLGAMADAGGALAVDRVALACGIVWIVDLLLLVIVMGINSLGGQEGPPE